jgi:hypothetical protein
MDLRQTHIQQLKAIDWRFLEAQFGSVYSDGPRALQQVSKMSVASSTEERGRNGLEGSGAPPQRQISLANPANSGLVAEDQEISVSRKMRGGGCSQHRTRTDLMTSASMSAAGTRRTDPARSAAPWKRAEDR